MDFPGYFPRIASALGTAYTLSGRVADAVPLLTQALKLRMVPEWTGLQSLCYLSLGDAHALAGSLGDAHTVAERALALAQEHQECGREAYALRLLGEIHAHRGPAHANQAETHYRQALALAAELGMRPLLAHGHRGLGTLYLHMGRLEQARTELSVAIDLYHTMDMAFWLPQAEAAMAQVEG